MQTIFFTIFAAVLIVLVAIQVKENIQTVVEAEQEERYRKYKEEYAQACADLVNSKGNATVELKGAGWDNEGKLI